MVVVEAGTMRAGKRGQNKSSNDSNIRNISLSGDISERHTLFGHVMMGFPV